MTIRLYPRSFNSLSRFLVILKSSSKVCFVAGCLTSVRSCWKQSGHPWYTQPTKIKSTRFITLFSAQDPRPPPPPLSQGKGRDKFNTNNFVRQSTISYHKIRIWCLFPRNFRQNRRIDNWCLARDVLPH